MEANENRGNGATRVVVASDIRLYRDALERAFRGASGIDLVGAASGAENTLKQVELLMPDVVLLDMVMVDAFAVAKQIPRVSPRTCIVALGMPEVEAEIIACAEIGIAGYVPRGGSLDDAFEAVHAVARGELRCSPRIAGFLFRHIATISHERSSPRPAAGLTAREAQILRLLQDGLSNKMISRNLGIELPTVKNHVHSLLAKLGVHRRAEAVSLIQRAARAQLDGPFAAGQASKRLTE
jgi:two-component system, NarL family, nitrate/nitrite response regulator NarL